MRYMAVMRHLERLVGSEQDQPLTRNGLRSFPAVNHVGIKMTWLF